MLRLSHSLVVLFRRFLNYVTVAGALVTPTSRNLLCSYALQTNQCFNIAVLLCAAHGYFYLRSWCRLTYGTNIRRLTIPSNMIMIRY